MKRYILATFLWLVPSAITYADAPTPSPVPTATPSPSPSPWTALSIQGRVSVEDSWFSGTGDFRFALVDTNGEIRWTNDSNIPAVNSVPLYCDNGVFNALLGDSSYSNMSSLPNDIFLSHSIYALRSWFDDGVNGVQQLTDTLIGRVPYAVQADYLGSHYTRKLYVDCTRTDDYTPDGTFTRPFKKVKDAYLWAQNVIKASSTRRVSISVATGIYYEDNPIVMLNCVFTQGDFKHNPRIIPLNQDEPLFSATAGDGAATSYRSCDYGDLTLYAPQNNAVWFFDTDSLPIVGLYQNLVWGNMVEGSNSCGVWNQNTSGGFHNVNCQSYGDFKCFAKMDGGNWRDAGHIGHFGNKTETYLYQDGKDSHAEVDLIVNNSSAVSCFFDIGGDETTQLLISNCVSFAANTDIYVHGGKVRANSCDFRGKTVLTGGTFTITNTSIKNDTEPPITVGAMNEVSIRGNRLEATQGGDYAIDIQTPPTTLEISNNSIYTAATYSVFASETCSAILNSNYLENGYNAKLIPITDSVPVKYLMLQSQDALASPSGQYFPFQLDSNGILWVTSTDNVPHQVWP